MSGTVEPGPLPVSTIPAEARGYQGQRAGIVTRVVANIIDAAVVVAVVVALYCGWVAFRYVLHPRGFSVPSAPAAITVLAVLLWAQFLYFSVAWMTSGRTYGDHVMGLRVVNAHGERVRPWTAVLRGVFCVLFPIGLFWVAVSAHNRSVQDVALRTSVVYDWTVRLPRAAGDGA